MRYPLYKWQVGFPKDYFKKKWYNNVQSKQVSAGHGPSKFNIKSQNLLTYWLRALPQYMLISWQRTWIHTFQNHACITQFWSHQNCFFLSCFLCTRCLLLAVHQHVLLCENEIEDTFQLTFKKVPSKQQLSQSSCYVVCKQSEGGLWGSGKLALFLGNKGYQIAKAFTKWA